jgi:hypothetical protein
MNGGPSVTWATAKAKSDEIKGHPARRNGFFQKHFRRLSTNLPRFNGGGGFSGSYAEKEKFGRGRWSPAQGTFSSRLRTLIGGLLRKARMRLLIALGVLCLIILFYVTRTLTSPHRLRYQADIFQHYTTYTDEQASSAGVINSSSSWQRTKEAV